MKVFVVHKPTVSVIIPVKNEEQVISESLSSVFNQSLKPKEVIIVDGRSTDDTLKKASQFPVKIITESEPTSLPHGRNQGIENAKGEIVFIMDADIILEENCIANAIKYFDNPAVIGVIPTESNIAHCRFEKIQIDWIRGSANPIRSGIGISVFAEFLRAPIFEKIKFDPNLGYMEDGDFQKRLRKLHPGPGKIVQARDSLISAHYSHTLNELRTAYTWYGRTFRRYLQKDFSIKPILNLGSLLAPTILILLIFLEIILPFFAPLSILLALVAAFLVARNLMICYRTKSTHFLDFLAFEFIRSLFFSMGIIQSFFSKKKGR
jgi:glycosyltransferase involved in cell wall biosynthesis